MVLSNFEFLKEKWPMLAQLGKLAEKDIYDDSNTTIFKLGALGEILVKYMMAYEKIDEDEKCTHADRIRTLKSYGVIPGDIDDILYQLRINRNEAVHEVYDSVEEAKVLTSMAFKLCVWFMQVYGEWDFESKEFIMPENQNDLESIEKENIRLNKEYEEENKKLKAELRKLRENTASQDNKERKKQSAKAAKLIKFNEEETRRIIDEKIRQAGWEVDSVNLRYSKETRPQKGKNMAIAEWPTDASTGRKSGRADYGLFIGEKLVGIVEAKKGSRDVPSDIQQSKDYARNIKNEHEKYVLKEWDKYKVPFLFATNGREYLKQIKEKSGIWFLDARKPTNHAKALQGWYTPEGLERLLEFDVESANEELKKDSMDYLQSKDGLSLREYQINAIKAAEKAIENNQKNVLLSMATGTGKTRTVVGLIYRFIKAKRFRRILFLVDRSALGNQAEDTFKEAVIEDLTTFADIYEIKGLEEKRPEEETKLHLATVQGMVKRIMYNEDKVNMPNVDDYDCIVIDEAHRGYILDKEMGEVELDIRDQKDYVSKYTSVIEYFDAFKIALTATPALHTTTIFGKPVFKYSYREAVVDGFLVDHEPPHQLTTKLKESGIHFEKGKKVEVYDRETGQVIDIDELEDELHFEVENFNRTVINENFNRVVLEEIAQNIDPEGEEKTLIFAVSDSHADSIVNLLKEIYEAMGIEVHDDAIMKITGSIKEPLEAIKRYKNETYPSIAVTVDLLSTGVDVPEITNLVFMRRVKSRILYEQMLGRATRLCDRIGKTHFNIYDAVGLYECLQDVTNMKPVVKSTNVTFKTLVNELSMLEEEKDKKNHIEEILAKLQRKKKTFDKDREEHFKHMNDGNSIDEFIEHIKSSDLEDVIKELKVKPELIEFLDLKSSKGNRVIVLSEHEDILTDHSRGYGEAKKPEDYLEEFNKFIQENINKIPALEIVCQRPKELTRETLKSLKLELDKHGFNEMNLNTAWRNMSNEDITADIISFIRQQALNDALMDHNERIKGAMKKIRGMNNWNAIQKKWLDRIEKQLLDEPIINRETFANGAFKNQGGYVKINKVFNNNLDELIERINENLYSAI